jgi:hypothetical protein
MREGGGGRQGRQGRQGRRGEGEEEEEEEEEEEKEGGEVRVTYCILVPSLLRRERLEFERLGWMERDGLVRLVVMVSLHNITHLGFLTRGTIWSLR